MVIEKTNVTQCDSDKFSFQTIGRDKSPFKMTGQITDYIYKKGDLVETREGHNIVVADCLKVLMCLLKRDPNFTGIQYWAIGSGRDTWDREPVDPRIDEFKLTNEEYRVAISPSEISFLNEDFDKVEDPTNIIEIRHIFSEEDCNGVWREFAIFGGDATSSANSGFMINKKHHPIITKTSEMTVERVLRFTLSLA